MACGGRGSGGGSIAPGALAGLDTVEDVAEAFVLALGGFLDADESFRLRGRGLGGIVGDESGGDAGMSGCSTRRAHSGVARKGAEDPEVRVRVALDSAPEPSGRS